MGMVGSETWYVAVSGRREGPMSAEDVIGRIREGRLSSKDHVFNEGMATWEPAGSRPEFAAAFGPLGASAAVPPPPPAGQVAHEIDYEIVGEEMQFVEITLDPNEACIAEAGAFMYMDPGIQMETIFGDGSPQQQGGLMGALLAAGKRVLVGESLFMTLFGNTASTRQKVAFAAPYPGRIVPMDLRQLGGTVLCQKDAFLCAAKGISVGIAFQKKLGTGLFGGEGFILEKLQGDGLAFVHASGAIVSRQLGQAKRCASTPAAWSPSSRE